MYFDIRQCIHKTIVLKNADFSFLQKKKDENLLTYIVSLMNSAYLCYDLVFHYLFSYYIKDQIKPN